MFKDNIIFILGGACIVAGLAIGIAQSQDAPRPAADGQGARGDNRGGDRGGDRGGADRRAEFRARMSQLMKERLGATDDEWKVLEPRIEKVTTLQAQNRLGGVMGMMGGFGRRGGEGGPGGGGPGGGGPTGGGPSAGGPGGGGPFADLTQSEVGKAAQALNTTLENKSATPDEIKTKVEALRTARAKSREELLKAQSELRDILNVRQEAQLVALGLLD